MEQMINQEDGFGEATLAELAELRKALEIGYSQPVTGTGFDALRVESLEQTLKLLTYSAQHVKFWNMIPKDDAFSTVEEYNQLVQYGADGGGFVPSGVLPEEEDTTYVRADQKVKYLGTTRAVTHPSTLVRTVPADLIGQETQNGTLWIMGKANQALYYGDSDAVPLEWNGVTKQIIDGGGTVIDLMGQPLATGNLEDAAQIIVDNFGIPQNMFSNSKVFTDFDKLQTANSRFLGPNTPAGYGGTPTTGWRTLVGQIDFQPDVFVRKGSLPPSVSTSPKAPGVPSVVAGAGTGTGSSFGTNDLGTYNWQVTAVNQYGESAPSVLSNTATPTLGQVIPLTISDGGGVFPATAYKIYRTQKDGSVVAYCNLRIARATGAGGVPLSTTVYNDDNGWRPGCFIGLVLDMTAQSLTFKQLAPMMKMNLAVISPAIRWMQLLYGTPIVYAPKKNVVFKNIGVAS